jgi:hypothetical protein
VKLKIVKHIEKNHSSRFLALETRERNKFSDSNFSTKKSNLEETNTKEEKKRKYFVL